MNFCFSEKMIEKEIWKLHVFNSLFLKAIDIFLQEHFSKCKIYFYFDPDNAFQSELSLS